MRWILANISLSIGGVSFGTLIWHYDSIYANNLIMIGAWFFMLGLGFLFYSNVFDFFEDTFGEDEGFFVVAAYVTAMIVFAVYFFMDYLPLMHYVWLGISIFGFILSLVLWRDEIMAFKIFRKGVKNEC